MGHIFLYGPPGSGKSTVGSHLAASLDLPFIDLDAQIEKEMGQSISQIVNEQGESIFRDLESAMLKRVSLGSAGVIALGGGTLLRDANRTYAESVGDVVFLNASEATLLRRLKTKAEQNQRPLLQGDLKGRLVALLADRKKHYESFDLRIAIDNREPEIIVWEIQQKLGRFHVLGMGSGYDVYIQSGCLDRLGGMLVEGGIGKTVAVVADSNISLLYGERVMESLRTAGCATSLLTIQAGEKHKTLETVLSLWQGFLAAGLDRKSTIVALGGGVTGDLAGFAASAYMRGIPWVAVPTSLLAMIDSSLGGKTGCDLPEGKNLIGSFHPPRLVVSDPDTLSTLPEEELCSGLGEVVKHGIIADTVLFDLCSKGLDAVKVNLPEIVNRAIAVKIKVIESDPFEQGVRAALNLGHTIGHALETVSGYQLRHGEAVSIGMVAEARLAERLKLAAPGLSETIAVTLMGLGLPVQIPSDLPRADILHAVMFDKKKDSGSIRFALPVAIGKVRVGLKIDRLDMIFPED